MLCLSLKHRSEDDGPGAKAPSHIRSCHSCKVTQRKEDALASSQSLSEGTA